MKLNPPTNFAAGDVDQRASRVQTTHIPRLDGVRAVAVAMVLVEHFGPNWLNILPWGAMGVQAFFVLSGFLITGILLECRRSDGESAKSIAFSTRRFYMRRIIRIFPLYFATIAITTAFGIGDSRAALPWTLTYTVNYYTIEVNKFPAFVGHFWTLAVEEQFYLLWPLLVLTLPKRMLLPTFLGAAAIGVLWKCVTYPLTSNLYITICPTPSSFDSLALGAILSLASHPAYGLSQTLLARWSLRIGLPVSIIYLFSRISDWFILADFGFALLCVWLLHRIISEPKSLRFLAWSPIAYIGRISYGIYVLHFFAFAIFLKLTKHHPLGPRSIPTLTVVTLICIAIASTSFWLFEKPINDLKRRFPYKRMDDRGATLTLAASSTGN